MPSVDAVKLSNTVFPELYPNIKVTKKVFRPTLLFVSRRISRHMEGASTFIQIIILCFEVMHYLRFITIFSRHCDPIQYTLMRNFIPTLRVLALGIRNVQIDAFPGERVSGCTDFQRYGFPKVRNSRGTSFWRYEFP